MGVIDHSKEHFTLIMSDADIEALHFPPHQPLALLTQTTLSVDDTAEKIRKIQEKYPYIVLPPVGDICYATTNRQKAVRALAEQVDMILVVGSPESSNSGKLRDLAKHLGKEAYLIDTPQDIQVEWIGAGKTIGITAGASGPEELVDAVRAYLEDH